MDTYLPREGTETDNQQVLFSCSRQYRYLSTSRGDGNTIVVLVNCVISFCIDTYLPREGTETFHGSSPLLYGLCIATYLPREGTETFLLLDDISSVSTVCIDTYLPR